MEINISEVINMIIFVCPKCARRLGSLHGYREKCDYCGTAMIETKYDNFYDEIPDEEIDKLIFEEYVKGNPLYDERAAQYTEYKLEEGRKQTRLWQAGLLPKKKKEDKNVPKCPKCGSTAITAGQRGYSILTGFLGSGQTVNRCANCGYKWKPRG